MWFLTAAALKSVKLEVGRKPNVLCHAAVLRERSVLEPYRAVPNRTVLPRKGAAFLKLASVPELYNC